MRNRLMILALPFCLAALIALAATLPVAGDTPPPLPSATIDLSGSIDGAGVLQQDVEHIGFGGSLTVNIGSGTTAQEEGGGPLQEVTIEEVCFGYPPPPAGNYVTGCAYGFGPNSATFDPPITISLLYDEGLIPAGFPEEDLTLAYYDVPFGQWVILPSTVNTATNVITANTDHFTLIAAYAPAEPTGYRDIPLVEGWNLVNMPLTPTDDDIATVTAGIDANLIAVHSYDAATASWTQFDGPGGAFDTLATVNDDLGYWFQMSAPDTLTVWGQAALVADIEAPPGADGYHDTTLVEGWNLIGLPLIPTDNNIAVVTAGIDPNLIAVHSYDAATASWTQFDGPGGAFDTLATIGDGLGYWFQMSAPDTLTVWGTPGLLYE